MPYQHLSSEIMLAVSIWLVAIFIFVLMLLAVFAKLISENRTKSDPGSKDEVQGLGGYPVQSQEAVPVEETDLNYPR